MEKKPHSMGGAPLSVKVVVAVYNSEKWIGKCLQSISSQVHSNWRGIVVDDCSADNTPKIIRENLPSHMEAIFNNKRVGALSNQIHAVQMMECGDEDVIVIVDGDDWLSDADVFDKLADVYQNPDVWLTYGNYEVYPKGKIRHRMRVATENDNPRTGPWLYRHLRTFKYFLWKNVKDSTLRYSETGDYFPHATDIVVTKPMVEMAGLSHTMFIDDIMYVYNFTNPISKNREESGLHYKCCREVDRQTPYTIKTKKELIGNG